MAGTNDFKAFATDANANVTSQEEWETLTALKKGFSSGKASSAQVSKALRQPSTMAAVLGQFIANAELDALDDGDVDGLVAKLATAITTNLGLQETVNKAGNAVQKTGDTLSGGLTFENDSILAWIRNTDWAKIGFK
ncbi:TPA: phage tail protein, partial [Escherichia coli]